jgi:hypothetical protein
MNCANPTLDEMVAFLDMEIELWTRIIADLTNEGRDVAGATRYRLRMLHGVAAELKQHKGN